MTAESRAASDALDVVEAAVMRFELHRAESIGAATIRLHGDLLAILAARVSHSQPEQADDGQATGEPDGLRAAVEALTYASDDGTEYEHNGHGPNEGEPECPGCWVMSLRAALAANPPTSGSETDRG